MTRGRVLNRTVRQIGDRTYELALEIAVEPAPPAPPGFRQSADGAGFSAILPEDPGPGSLILLQCSNVALVPTGFTDLFGSVVDTGVYIGSAEYRLWYRVAQPGDTRTYGPQSGTFEWTISEFTGPAGASTVWNIVHTSTVTQQGPDSHPHRAFSPVHAGEILAIGAPVHSNTLRTAFVADAGWTSTAIHEYSQNTVAFGIVHKIETNTGSYDPGVSTAPFNGKWGMGVAAFSAQ